MVLASKVLINTGERATLQGIPLISEGYFQRVGPEVIKIGSTALRLNEQYVPSEEFCLEIYLHPVGTQASEKEIILVYRK